VPSTWYQRACTWSITADGTWYELAYRRKAWPSVSARTSIDYSSAPGTKISVESSDVRVKQIAGSPAECVEASYEVHYYVPPFDLWKRNADFRFPENCGS